MLRADERPGAAAPTCSPTLDERVGGNDHFEFYWFPYTDRVQIKTQQPRARTDRPLPPVARLARRRVPVQHRVRRGLPARPGGAGAGARPSAASRPGRCPRAPTPAASDRVFCTPRRVRFVEMEYGLPRAALPRGVRRRCAGSSTGCRSRCSSRSRSGSPPPTTSGSPTGTGGTTRTSRSTSTSACRTRSTSGRSRRSATPLGGRPHWGKMHCRDAASLADGVPALRRLPRRARPARPRARSSPTPTPATSSAPESRRRLRQRARASLEPQLRAKQTLSCSTACRPG